METGKNCKMVWSGDTGFGGVFVKVPYCKNAYTPKASNDNVEVKKVQDAKVKRNSKDWSVEIAGFSTFVISSIWRYWSR